MRKWLLILIIVLLLVVVFLFFAFQSGFGGEVLESVADKLSGNSMPRPPALPS